MSSSTVTLVVVARYLLIYGGITMIIFGMFGSAMVILIFTQRPFNNNPCSIYIVTNGILEFFFLPLYYLPNIMTFGFQINWLGINSSFCKFQMSYAGFTITSVFIINCFISFDRYVTSTTSLHLRLLSSKRMAFLLVTMGLIFVWCTIGIPVVILFENIPTDSNGTIICSSHSRLFLIIAALFYFPILEGILPICLAIFFWYFTRRNVHNLHNEDFIRRFDRQMTRMYFFQMIASAIASFPFATINLYRSLTSQSIRSVDQENIVQFFRLLAIWIFYIQYCIDFYIYCATSNVVFNRAKKFFFSYK